MDFHLDTLLNFPNTTVEQCRQEAGAVFLTLRLFNDTADCPHCGQSSGEWNQSRFQEIYSEATKTIRNHLEGICNYFLNRTTSGPMEGINNRIKLIKREAYGFRNFGNFRKRLLACFSN